MNHRESLFIKNNIALVCCVWGTLTCFGSSASAQSSMPGVPLAPATVPPASLELRYPGGSVMVYVQRPNLTFVAGCRTPCSMAVVPRTSVVLSTLPNGANAVLVRVPETGLVLDVASPSADPRLPLVSARDWSSSPAPPDPEGNWDLTLVGVLVSVTIPTGVAFMYVFESTCPFRRTVDPIPWIAGGAASALLGPLITGLGLAARATNRRPVPPGFRPLVALNPVITQGYQGLTVSGQF